MLRAIVLYACALALIGLGLAGVAVPGSEWPILAGLCLVAGVILLSLPPPQPPADPIMLPFQRRRGA